MLDGASRRQAAWPGLATAGPSLSLGALRSLGLVAHHATLTAFAALGRATSQMTSARLGARPRSPAAPRRRGSRKAPPALIRWIQGRAKRGPVERAAAMDRSGVWASGAAGPVRARREARAVSVLAFGSLLLVTFSVAERTSESNESLEPRAQGRLSAANTAEAKAPCPARLPRRRAPSRSEGNDSNGPQTVVGIDKRFHVKGSSCAAGDRPTPPAEAERRQQRLQHREGRGGVALSARRQRHGFGGHAWRGGRRR